MAKPHPATCLSFATSAPAIIKSEEVKPDVIPDYGKNNNVVGIEMLGLSKRVPAERLKSLQFETV